MVYFILAQLLSFLLDLVAMLRLSDHEKDLELLLLRQQVRILQRKLNHPPRISRGEKLALAVLAAKFTQLTTSARVHLGQILVLFKPETVVKWHRQLVHWKWTCKQRRVVPLSMVDNSATVDHP